MDTKDTTNKTFKAVIIGCGRIAGYFDSGRNGRVYSHAQAYYLNPHIEVVDYVDIKLEKARRLAKKYGSDNYSPDFAVSIDRNRPDVVSVCTPDNTHFDVTKNILKMAAVPSVIFMEKPVSSDIKELDCLRALSKERGVLILVNLSRRFSRRYQKLRSMIRSGAFGGLVRGDIYYYGGWVHNGIHVVDTLLFLFGGDLGISDFYEYAATRHEDDPTLELKMKFKDKTGGIYLHAFDERHYQLFDFDFKFEKRRLRTENFETEYILEKKTVNSMDENVLAHDRLVLGPDIPAPIENAVGNIAKYLKTKNKRYVKNYTIDTVEKTMRVLWEGTKRYEAELIKQRPCH